VPADAQPTELTPEQKARDAARVPLASALVDAYTNETPIFSRDRKRVLFRSDRDGSPQLYLGDATHPEAPALALTHGPERVSDAEVTRDGRSVVFLRDQGADENFRIWKVGLDGKNLVNLTPGVSRHRDAPIEPSRKPGMLVYTQHDPRSPSSELVVQSLAGGQPKAIYTDPSPATVADVTADGRRALLVRHTSSSESAVIEVDLASGDSHRIYPAPKNKAHVSDARYAVDGKRVFVAADDGAEGQHIYGLDAATGEVLAQHLQDDPPTAFVSSIQVSPRGDRLAIGVNAGNRSEARIIDAKSLALIAKVKAPLGWVETTRFSDDGARFGLTVSTPSAPGDIFSVDASTGELTPLRKDARAGLDAMKPLTPSIENVKAFDGLNLPINTYLPQGGGGGAKLPVVVNFHAGPYSSSQVRWDPSARYFTSLGYAYLEPNVRGSTGFGRAYEMADDREKRADWL